MSNKWPLEASYLDSQEGERFTYIGKQYRPFSFTGVLKKGKDPGSYELHSDMQVILFTTEELAEAELPILWKGGPVH